MEADYLIRQLQLEQDDDKYFQPTSFHFVEISTLILNNAADDIPEAERIRTIIADICALRACKISAGLQKIQAGAKAYKLNNIAAMELNTIRSVYLQAMNSFAKVSEEPVMTLPVPASSVSQTEPARKLRRFR